MKNPECTRDAQWNCEACGGLLRRNAGHLVFQSVHNVYNCTQFSCARATPRRTFEVGEYVPATHCVGLQRHRFFNAGKIEVFGKGSSFGECNTV